MISYRIGISGGDVNSIYLPESKTCFAWLILTISSELIHFGMVIILSCGGGYLGYTNNM
jgi:hypothetical protein